jgi:hypothetical protein
VWIDAPLGLRQAPSQPAEIGSEGLNEVAVAPRLGTSSINSVYASSPIGHRSSRCGRPRIAHGRVGLHRHSAISFNGSGRTPKEYD